MAARRWSVVAAAVLTLLATGCGGGSDKKTVSAPTSSAPATSSTTAKPALDATGLLAVIEARGVPVAESKTYDASSDPNEQLGRPGGYTSKVSWHDSRLGKSDDFDVDGGGSIETFPSSQDAQRRFDYVDGITRGNAMLNEYHWIVGGVHFLRVSKSLTPDQANQYRDAAQSAFG